LIRVGSGERIHCAGPRTRKRKPWRQKKATRTDLGVLGKYIHGNWGSLFPIELKGGGKSETKNRRADCIDNKSGRPQAGSPSGNAIKKRKFKIKKRSNGEVNLDQGAKTCEDGKGEKNFGGKRRRAVGRDEKKTEREDGPRNTF